jgi:hypothetical protein
MVGVMCIYHFSIPRKNRTVAPYKLLKISNVSPVCYKKLSWCKYYVLMDVSGKMRPDETIP